MSLKVFKINLLLISFLFFFSLLIIKEATATTYYVDDDTCPNTGSGTITAPYCTIQKAADIVNPGDTVIVKDGIYTGGNYIVSLNRGGAADNWITFKSENKWGAVIDGRKNTSGYCWNFGASANYVRVENFEIKGCAWGGFWNNSQAHHNEIYGNHIHNIGRRCTISKYGQSGIFLGQGTASWTINSNVIHDNGRFQHGENGCYYGPCPEESNSNPCHYYKDHDHGIYTVGEQIDIINNIFYEHKSGWGVQVAGYCPTCGTNYNISNNNFIGDNPSLKGQIILWDNADDIIIQNNIFYGSLDVGITYNNCSVKSNIILRNNIIDNSLLTDSDYNNTQNCPFINSNNIFNTDPIFVDANSHNYRLQPTSAAIDKGISTNVPSYDYEGYLRDSKPDIGAFEYVSGAMPIYLCSDGTDNDGDGLTDYPSDPGCSSSTDNDEYNAPQQPSENSIISLKTTSPITIDGNLSDRAWGQANYVTFSNPSRSDNQVKVYTLWDDNNLYFTYEVTDPDPEAINQALHQDDGAEIYLDTDHNKTSFGANDYQFVVNINNLFSGGTISTKTVTNSQGYTTEIAIPWKTISATPTANKTMGLLLGNNDRDNGTSSQFDWLNLIETGSYYNPNLWGDITLSSQTASLPVCDSFTYSEWSSCEPDNTQSRTVISSLPADCEGGNPVLAQSCTYIPPTCTSFGYSSWSACQPDNTQTRTVISSSPEGCEGGNPIESQSCAYTLPPSENSIISLKTTSPITIDGNLSDRAWGQANYVTFSNPSRSDNEVKVYTLWDDNNLYFTYEVKDPDPEAINQALHQDDGAEIYLDTDHNKTSFGANDYQFVVNINNLFSGGTISTKTVTNPNGYTTEIAIPWTTISTTPSANKTMGLLLGNNDRDNGASAQFDWLNLIETGSYYNPNLWGAIVISDEQIGIDDSPPGKPTGLIISKPSLR